MCFALALGCWQVRTGCPPVSCVTRGCWYRGWRCWRKSQERPPCCSCGDVYFVWFSQRCFAGARDRLLLLRSTLNLEQLCPRSFGTGSLHAEDQTGVVCPSLCQAGLLYCYSTRRSYLEYKGQRPQRSAARGAGQPDARSTADRWPSASPLRLRICLPPKRPPNNETKTSAAVASFLLGLQWPQGEPLSHGALFAEVWPVAEVPQLIAPGLQRAVGHIGGLAATNTSGVQKHRMLKVGITWPARSYTKP